jgi:hypothetical protein
VITFSDKIKGENERVQAAAPARLLELPTNGDNGRKGYANGTAHAGLGEDASELEIAK